MKPMRFLIVVCARAGSERLKGKNFLRVAGTPEYPVRVCDFAIGAAQKAYNFLDSRWCISSDDVRFCQEEPSNLVRRPERLCTAKASIHLALKHALQAWELDCDGPQFDAVISLQANVVTVTAGLVTQVAHLLERNKRATAVMTVKPAECPPEWMFHWGKRHPRFLERQATSKRFRMQDLPQRYVPTGTCCAVRREVLLGCKSSAAFKWLGDSILPAIENGTVIEIHDRIDLEQARAWLNRPAQWEDGK